MGSFKKSSQSQHSLSVQHDQYFLRSWKTATPLWWLQIDNPSNLTGKHCRCFPRLGNIYPCTLRCHTRTSLLCFSRLALYTLGSFLTPPAASSYFFFFSSISLLKSSAVLILPASLSSAELEAKSTGLRVLDGIRFEKINCFLFIGMLARGTPWNFLELIPVVNRLATAGPALLAVVEYRLARVECARSSVVLAVCVLLAAPRASAFLLLHFFNNTLSRRLLLLLLLLL